MKIRFLSGNVFDSDVDEEICEQNSNMSSPGIYGKVTLVAGPPGSGKSTFVRKHMQRGDLVVDLDELFRAITLIDDRNIPQPILPFGFEARDAIYRRMAKHHNVERIWVIQCAPRRTVRHNYRSMFNARIVVLEVPADRCLSRIYATPNRASNHIDWFDIVHKWWRDYEAHADDERITEISELAHSRKSFAEHLEPENGKSE